MPLNVLSTSIYLGSEMELYWTPVGLGTKIHFFFEQYTAQITAVSWTDSLGRGWITNDNILFVISNLPDYFQITKKFFNIINAML